MKDLYNDEMLEKGVSDLFQLMIVRVTYELELIK